MYNVFLCIKAEEADAEVCRNFDCEVLFAALTSVMATAKLLVTSMLLRRHGLCIPDVALGFQIDQLLTSYGKKTPVRCTSKHTHHFQVWRQSLPGHLRFG